MRRGLSNVHVYKVPILLSALGLLAPACAVDDELAPVTSTEEPGKGVPEHDESSILVKFRNTPSAAALQDVLTRVGGKIQDANGDRRDDRFTHLSKDSLARIDLQGPTRALEAIARLDRHPAIVYAEPNYIVHATLTPNDASFGQLWGMNNTGQTGGTAGADISAAQAWDVSVGSLDIVVGVIDTGVDYTHPDLATNAWVNPGEIAGNGLDDDGNGYVDDVPGINAITGSGNPMDDNGHGTHCAGIAGAVGDNSLGVAGVNWDVSLMALKFLNQNGSGSTAAAVECINYAVNIKTKTGVRILRLLFVLSRDYRPLVFFGAVALCFFVAGLAAGSLPVYEYYRTRLVGRFPLAILAAVLMNLSLFTLLTGVMLESGLRHRRESYQIRLRNYRA